VDNVTTVGGQSAISAPISSEQQRWLAALYEANVAAVSRRCGAILRSGDEAADAVHEVFLIALNSLAPDTEAKRARAWLLTVAQNHCVDVLRRQQRFGRALVKLGADRDARGDLEGGVVDRDFVDGLLRQLSLRERLALWQSAVEHRSLADIATGLQLSYAAAAQVVHRARRHALRLGAGIAAILVVLRPARVVRRVLERMTDGQSLLAAHRAIALAALPVVAALSMQSSTATGTAQPPAPAVAPAATLVNSGGLPAPAGLGALLAPLNGASDQLAAGTAGLTPSAGIPSAGIPSVATPTLKSLVDRVAQSTSQVASSIPPLPAAPLPPVPSLPPIGH
jgi:RNA polymerase sigma factor (sigma-70 family)